MKRFRQKQYTQWDETDQIKQMKDSDILAEQKRKNPSRWGGAFKGAATGTMIGAGALGTLGAIGGIRSGNVVGGLMKGLKRGAIAGGALGTVGGAAFIGNQQRKENNFYNNRLEYAQYKAQRREKADWKNNMNNREGYTY